MTPRRSDRPLRRRKNTRDQRRKVLIYCEGKAEETYLQGVRQELRGQPIRIVLQPANGECYKVVRAARQHKERVAGDPDERFDQVWCVIDVEAPMQAPGLHDALREAQRADIACVLTSPCFELWLILHFRDQRAYLTSKAAQQELTKLPAGYQLDGGKDFSYDKVLPGRADAVGRARALRGGHGCGRAVARRIRVRGWTRRSPVLVCGSRDA